MNSFLLFVYLQAMDVLTTVAVIARGGEEMNPALRWIFGAYPKTLDLVIAKLIMLVTVWLLLDVAEEKGKDVNWAMVVVNLLGMGIVAWNTWNLFN